MVKTLVRSGIRSFREQTRFDEAPLSMLIPLLLAASIVIIIGIYNQEVVNQIETFLQPFDLPTGVHCNERHGDRRRYPSHCLAPWVGLVGLSGLVKSGPTSKNSSFIAASVQAAVVLSHLCLSF